MSRANRRWFHRKSIFQRRGSWGRSSKSGNMFSKRRTNWGKILLIIAAALAVIAIGVFGYLNRDFLFQKKPKIEVAEINIQVQDMIMYQNESLPEPDVSIVCEKENEQILEFLENLKNGIGYRVECQEDLSIEGEYKLSFVWEDDIAEKLAAEWKEIIDIEIQTGTVTVKNELGEWEGDKFKKRDGSYVTGEFLTLYGEDYYFDENGKKVTGEYEISGRTYYFTEEGVFDTEKNKFHPTKPMIALTFDDGPGLYTEELLSVLKENSARATFFVLGEQVKKFPDEVKLIKEMGCEIGNHTYAHKRLTDLSKKDMLSQINKTNKEVKELIGSNTKLVRPPFGDVNSSVRKNVKYPLIMWSLDTEDWKLKDAAKIREVILSQVKDGDIVLMHDIHEFTFEAMKTVIPELIEEGYQLVTVSELAAWKGVKLENGTKYFEF